MSTDTQDNAPGRRHWTTTEDRQLEQLWLEGLSVVQIAVRMGRTTRAIGNRLNRRGLSVPRQPRRPGESRSAPAHTPPAQRSDKPAAERRVEVVDYAAADWAPQAPPGHGLRWAWRARVGEAEVTGATVGDRYQAIAQAKATAERLLAAHRGRGRDLREWHGDPDKHS